MSDITEKPAPIPPDPNAEPVKVNEAEELFPDSPVGGAGRRRDPVDVSEAEQVRIRTRSDQDTDRARERLRARYIEEGRVTFRIEGDDIRFMIFSCNACRALVLKTGLELHSQWHERLRRGQTA